MPSTIKNAIFFTSTAKYTPTDAQSHWGYLEVTNDGENGWKTIGLNEYASYFLDVRLSYND